jgi:hypothetical protein
MNLKSKIAAAMNRANKSPMDGGDKRKKSSKNKTTEKIGLPIKPVGKISYGGPKTLATNTQTQSATPKIKTKEDYKNERYQAKQEFKIKKQEARQERRLDKIKSREEGSGIKKAEGVMAGIGTALGLAETARRVFAKKKPGQE